ncbi:MAG: MgtC/SapB family protein [Halomonas sp.]|nr:MgtC/SapB family protein [Halomonas sp.]
MWLTVAIGVAVGLGREQTAVLCALLAWMVLYLVPFFSRPISKKKASTSEEDDDNSDV